jgi:hypothetical protein
MKLWGVAMARNEADVIEAFIRHNLTVLDGLAIVDHGSTDATPAILAALSAEGLPLQTEVNTALEFRQSEIVTQVARRILATTDADFISCSTPTNSSRSPRGSVSKPHWRVCRPASMRCTSGTPMSRIFPARWNRRP